MTEIKKIAMIITLCFVFLCIAFAIFINYETNSWKKNFGVSDIYIEKIGDLFPTYYVRGSIQNKTNDAVNVSIYIEFKSGSITQYETCYVSLSSRETGEIDCPIPRDSSIDDSFIPTVTKITYW